MFAASKDRAQEGYGWGRPHAVPVAAAAIGTELTVRATAKEEIFYPAVRNVIEETDLIDEAKVEYETTKGTDRAYPGGPA